MLLYPFIAGVAKQSIAFNFKVDHVRVYFKCLLYTLYKYVS